MSSILPVPTSAFHVGLLTPGRPTSDPPSPVPWRVDLMASRSTCLGEPERFLPALLLRPLLRRAFCADRVADALRRWTITNRVPAALTLEALLAPDGREGVWRITPLARANEAWLASTARAADLLLDLTDDDAVNARQAARGAVADRPWDLLLPGAQLDDLAPMLADLDPSDAAWGAVLLHLAGAGVGERRGRPSSLEVPSFDVDLLLFIVERRLFDRGAPWPLEFARVVAGRLRQGPVHDLDEIDTRTKAWRTRLRRYLGPDREVTSDLPPRLLPDWDLRWSWAGDEEDQHAAHDQGLVTWIRSGRAARVLWTLAGGHPDQAWRFSCSASPAWAGLLEQRHDPFHRLHVRVPGQASEEREITGFAPSREGLLERIGLGKAEVIGWREVGGEGEPANPNR